MLYFMLLERWYEAKEATGISINHRREIIIERRVLTSVRLTGKTRLGTKNPGLCLFHLVRFATIT